MRKFRIVCDVDRENPFEQFDEPATWAMFTKHITPHTDADYIEPCNEPLEDFALTLWAKHRPYQSSTLDNFLDGYGDRPEKAINRAIIWLESTFVFLPVYLYEHGGQTVRTTPFGCQWDSGQIGFVYIERSQAASEFFNGQRLSPKRVAAVEEQLRGTVQLYDDYLTGNVYGFQAVDESGEDSCYGFYGNPIEGLSQRVPEWAVPLLDEAFEDVGEWIEA